MKGFFLLRGKIFPTLKKFRSIYRACHFKGAAQSGFRGFHEVMYKL